MASLLRGGMGTASTSTLAGALLTGSLYGADALNAGVLALPLYGLGLGPIVPSVADYPAQGDVRAGVAYAEDTRTGTMTEPSESDVKAGVQYGADGTEYTGTLVSGGGDYPAESDVRNGVSYGAGAYTGTMKAGGNRCF